MGSLFSRDILWRSAAGFLWLLTAATLTVPPGHTAEWHLGVVPGAAGGQFSSFQIDKYGNAHVCSFGAAMHVLSYSFWDHATDKWFSTVLDGGGGFCSMALDSAQRPHISYVEYGTGKIKYANWDGAAWKKQALPITAKTISYTNSIALDAEDHPYIIFYQESGVGLDDLRLRMVSWNGRFWELRNVDTDRGSGKFNSLCIDAAGRPDIAYGNVSYENASLRFAHWNGTSWEREIIEGEGQPGTTRWSVALALDKQGVPHIAYTDPRAQLIKYSVKRAGKWDVQVVDAIRRTGYPDRNGIAVSDQGNVYISYDDAGQGVLKVAHRENSRWVSEVVDDRGVGISNCLRIAGDSIWVTYTDETGGVLHYAYSSLATSSGNAKDNGRGSQK